MILLPADSLSRIRAESHGQSLQESINQVQQSQQEARDHGQSRRKPNMTDSLCRKRKLGDSFILYPVLLCSDIWRSLDVGGTNLCLVQLTCFNFHN